MDIEIDLEIEGSMSQEQLNIGLQILGELIIEEIRKNIRSMNLIGDTTDFLQKWIARASNGILIIENATEYSKYLEYGTYAYWNMHGLSSYTDPSHPKKKNLSYKERKKYPKGIQAFAPVRKVLFNPIIMQKLASEAFS